MQAKQENTLGTRTKLKDMKGTYRVFAKNIHRDNTEKKQSKKKEKPETEIVYI